MMKAEASDYFIFFEEGAHMKDFYTVRPMHHLNEKVTSPYYMSSMISFMPLISTPRQRLIVVVILRVSFSL